MILNLIILGIIGGQELLLFISIIFWVWVLVDILKNEFKKDSDKTGWLIMFIFIPILLFLLNSFLKENSRESLLIIISIGTVVTISCSLIYYFSGKKQQVKKNKE